MGIRIASWAVVGIGLGLVSAWGTVTLNPSVRGTEGGSLLLWFFAAQLGLTGMVAGLHELVRRVLRADPTEAGASLVEVALAALGLALLLALTGFVESGAVRWGLRALLAPAVLAVAVRFGARVPPVPTPWIVGALAAVPAIAVAAWLIVIQPRLHAETEPAAVAAAPGPRDAGARRVLLIGIDGADWRHMDRLFAEGRLPVLQRLRAEGTSANLETMQPTWSPRLWNTVSTGLLPDEHGVLDFTELRADGWDCGIQRLQKDPLLPPSLALKRVVSLLVRAGVLSALPVTSCQRHAKALWNMASDSGRRAAAIGWFASWPSDPIDGYVVSDLNPFRTAFSARKGIEGVGIAGLTHPPELLEDLIGTVDFSDVADERDAVLALPFFDELSETQRAELRPIALSVFRTLYLSDGFSVGAAEELLRREPLDLVAVYLSGVDSASHRFARNLSVVERYYDAMDVFVGRLIEAAGPETVTVIVSDHGWDYPPDEPMGHFHAPDGILLIHGPGVPAARLERTPHVMDVAPTVLALLGMPRAEAMAGAAVTEALASDGLTASELPPLAYGGYRFTPPSREGTPGERQLQDDMMERLKALGYVDE